MQALIWEGSAKKPASKKSVKRGNKTGEKNPVPYKLARKNKLNHLVTVEGVQKHDA